MIQWSNSAQRWGAIAQVFHWTIVALVITQFVLANMAESLPLGMAKLATLARHAFGLAQSFNHFYHRQPILQEPDAAIRNRRLAITRIFRREMARLLALLGVPEPGRM